MTKRSRNASGITGDRGRRAGSALEAPAAERNKEAIAQVLRRVLPAQGLVLEVASGTGQHVVHFARALPRLSWQPSDPDPAKRASIRAHIQAGAGDDAEHGTIAEPIELDAQSSDWPVAMADAVLCINMIHIAPWSAAEGLMSGAARLLGPGAPLVLYGPFMRAGRHTAVSNEAFDANLKQRNPQWGVRDLDDVTALAQRSGFTFVECVPMPANNLTVVYSRNAEG